MKLLHLRVFGISLDSAPSFNQRTRVSESRFQNPIENGQHTNFTSDDVKIMNQRSHILYEQLKGFVQRMDMNVMKKDLPPKTVFVIAVKLSPMQRVLYKRFLDVHVHDRALFYYMLWQHIVSIANSVVNPPKQAVSVFADTQSSEIKDRIFDEFNSTSLNGIKQLGVTA